MKLKYTLLSIILAASFGAFAQYSGGSGSGYAKADVNSKYLTNFFLTNGTWSNSTNWRDNVVPSSSEEANISAIAELNGDYTYPEVNISAAGVVNIPAAQSLTVSENLNNLAGTSGLVIESGGSLLHNTSNVQATLRRTITGAPIPEEPGVSTRYHLVSIPLSPAVNSVSGQFTGAYLYGYDPSMNSWLGLGEQTNTPLDETVGYMVYYTSNKTVNFEGPMNNGNFSPSVTYAGLEGGNNFSLVPNPYPSAIDWHAFAPGDKTNIGNTIWIFNNGNYATYTWDGANSSNTNGGSRYIAPGQAFFVQTTGSSPALNMSNNIRTHSDSPFLKDTDSPLNQLRIAASANGVSDEVLLGFRNQASDDYHPNEDALKIYGSSGAPQLFTISGNKKLSANFMDQPAGPASVKLGFDCDFAGDYALSFSQLEAFPQSVSIYLTDELTSQTVNLRQQTNYNFVHNPGNNPERFTLKFGGTIGIEEPSNEKVQVWFNGNTLIINADEQTGSNSIIEVFNTTGQLLFSRQTSLSGQKTFKLNISGPVIAKVTTEKGIYTAKTILLNNQ
ncbi:MAG: hypothetical protein FD170_3727 [Bacteroidetes bacterium]|nr:MAG: hypothetical protein FD170_3727 [Bacteroidota bacterium]